LPDHETVDPRAINASLISQKAFTGFMQNWWLKVGHADGLYKVRRAAFSCVKNISEALPVDRLWGRHGMYLPTVAWLTLMPSLSSSAKCI
jgi:hypothetical protein